MGHGIGETTMHGTVLKGHGRIRPQSIHRYLAAVAVLLALLGCASQKKEMNALDRAQYDYSAAIRWGDFEGAYTLVDPEVRDKQPLTDLQVERFKQIQISAYRDLGSTIGQDQITAAREIQIGIINRNNMTERSIRYSERWRYDAAKKRWWVTSGLPDFWQGE